MNNQNNQDALDRALTDLYKADIPGSYRASWRAAVKREEELTLMKKPVARKPLWRFALPVAAALVLTIGAITAGNLIPTVVDYDRVVEMPKTASYSSAPAPMGRSESVFVADQSAVDAESDMEYDNFAVEEASPMTAAAYSVAADGAALTGSAAAGSANMADAEATAETTDAAVSKIVRTVDLTIATTNFDADTDALTQLTQALNGYVESVNARGEASVRMDRVSYYNLRIPSDQLDAFLSDIGEIGRVTARSETSTDMSTQYADHQMRLTTQRAKMERLQQLLAQATDVSDLVQIESEIANTQYQIDWMESEVRTIDRDVNTSAVSVTLREESARQTAQVTELTLWQRIGSGFKASIQWFGTFAQNLLVFLAMALPVLIPLIVLGVILWLVVRLRRQPKRGKPDTAPDRQPDEHNPNP